MGIRRVGSCLLSARRSALKEPWPLRGIICDYLVSNTVIAHYAIMLVSVWLMGHRLTFEVEMYGGVSRVQPGAFSVVSWAIR